MNIQLYWHFSNGSEAHGSHRKLIVGKTYRVRGKPALCQHGLHASERALDALHYGSGNVVSQVTLGGTVIADTDKQVATQRTVIAQADATDILHEFACWCGEQALLKERERGREPDARSWAAIEAKRAWLRGEINDDQLAAARDAARDAGRDAAWAATWAAARDAAWAATWDAAGGADKAAARDATWAAQNAKLEEMLRELLA